MGEVIYSWFGAQSRVPLFDMAFIELLSFTAVVSTIGLFLCGIPICLDIRKKNTSEGANPAPFLLGVMSSLFWLRYGFLKEDHSIVTVNGIGLILQACYLSYFYIFSRTKRLIQQQIIFLLLCSFGMLGYIQLYSLAPEMAAGNLGLMCMFLNILNFAAPLTGLRQVLKDGSCDSLPLPLCAANLLVSTQWFIYGNLVDDPYIKIPNCIGIVLAIIQLSFFLIYPRKRVQRIK